jgi:predicted methyltransferase
MQSNPATCRAARRAANVAAQPRMGKGRIALATICLLLAMGNSRAATGPDAPGQAAAALPDYHAILSDPVRSDSDRNTDERRKPLELLRFAQVRPGMKVLDVSAGGGYTTQLLALAVGPDGAVWAQMAKPRESFEKRLAAHPQANIHLLVRPFDDPYPADAPRLDLITFILNYHDVANEAIDRAVMNQRLFAALKPGGHLVLIDHAAAPGSGLRDTKTLHRIDEEAVVSELQRAGFRVEERSAFLHVADDPHTQAFFDMKTPSDRFALRLVRP